MEKPGEKFRWDGEKQSHRYWEAAWGANVWVSGCSPLLTVIAQSHTIAATDSAWPTSADSARPGPGTLPAFCFDKPNNQAAEQWPWYCREWKVKVKVLVDEGCLTLCSPMDCSPQGSSVHGILQARILEWVAIPFSRGSSQPREQTWVSCIAGWLYHLRQKGGWVQGEPPTSSGHAVWAPEQWAE